MQVKYASASPYAATPQLPWRIKNYVHRAIPIGDSDQLITIKTKHEYRPDLLSFELYNTPEYWWVFMVRNMDVIRDPIWDLKAGMTITAPSLAAIQAAQGQV
jgi:hypothetical protein